MCQFLKNHSIENKNWTYLLKKFHANHGISTVKMKWKSVMINNVIEQSEAEFSLKS